MNWILMIGVCSTGLRISSNVTLAHGLSIALDLIVTSCFYYFKSKETNAGAWLPIMMASIFFILFSFWRWARSKAIEQKFNTRIRIDNLYPSFNKVPENKTIGLTHITNDNNWMYLGGEVIEYSIELPEVLNSSNNVLTVNSRSGSTILQRKQGSE